MRQQIIEALTYPRIMLLASLDGDECPQHLYFNPTHDKCKLCEQGEECHWLNIHDEFSILVNKPMHSLYESLQFCIDYVNVQCGNAGHNIRHCACESCAWIRSARRIASDYRHVN